MSYLLQQTHDLLQKSLANANAGNDFLTSACEELQNFKPRFLQSAASVTSVESLRVLIEVTATGCTEALNLVSLLQQQAGQSGSSQPNLSRLEAFLTDILLWLHTRFGSYISNDIQLPAALVSQELADARQVLSELSAEAGTSACGEWGRVISDLVNHTFEAGSAYVSYRQVSYSKSLLSGIRSLSMSSGEDTTVLDSWAKLLIRYNCNDASVIRLLVKKLVGEANDIISLATRIEKWNWFKKELTQVVECGAALHPGLCSVKASLLSVISSELAWLEQKESALSSVYGSRLSSSPNLPASAPFLTTLSVSQLAVWCRLLFDCGIFKHDNQSELLKRVAGSLQTTRAANISPDSLRAKYYSPDRAALAVVKEHLFRMMTLVKDM